MSWRGAVPPPPEPSRVWATSFCGDETRAASTDSGFASFDEVRAVMGAPAYEWPGGLIYGPEGGEQVLFSRVRWAASCT